MRRQPRAGDRVQLAQHRRRQRHHEGARRSGAFDFVTKPKRCFARTWRRSPRELIAKIKAAADSKLKPRTDQPGKSPRIRQRLPLGYQRAHEVVAIGISTGGPQALRVCAVAIARGFSGSHRWWCSTCPKALPKCLPGAWMKFAPMRRERSAIRRPAAGRPRADLSRQPPHEGQAAAAGRHRGAERRSAGQRTSPVGGCAVPVRRRRIRHQGRRPC